MSDATTNEGTLNGQDLIFALDLANAVRDIEQKDKLKQLPFAGATPSNASECVLAQAFNFDCRVDYSAEDAITVALENDERVDFAEFHDYGVVEFDSKAHAEALAAELKVPVVPQPGYYDDEDEEFGPFRVPLPTRVAEIARLFDDSKGRDTLDGLAHELGWDGYYDDEGGVTNA